MASSAKTKSAAKQFLSTLEHGVSILKHYLEEGGEEVEEVVKKVKDKVTGGGEVKRKRGRPRKNPEQDAG